MHKNQTSYVWFSFAKTVLGNIACASSFNGGFVKVSLAEMTDDKLVDVGITCCHCRLSCR